MSSMSFGLTPKPEQNLKQLQRLMMSPQMRQAINLMQLPIMELSAVVEAELELNPILDSNLEPLEEENSEENQDQDTIPEKELKFDDKDLEILRHLDEEFRDHFDESENYYTKRTADEEKLKTYIEQSVLAEESLFDHLMHQANDTFQTEEEVAIAEVLIGNFDENGFLSASLEELSLLNNFDEKKIRDVLEEIQTFEPFGVGAASIRESMMIQLQCKGKKDTLAYSIVKECYEDLLNNKIPSIAKNLDCTIEEVREAINKQLAHLDLHPGVLYSRKPTPTIYVDATIKLEDEELIVVVNDEQMPSLRFNSRYLRMLDDETLSTDAKDFIKAKIGSAKWLMKNIEQRNTTIFRILSLLTEKQKRFFIEIEGTLTPLTMKSVAQELSVHESTVARAVANKYVDTPRGLFPLRYFFSNQYITATGDDLSSKTVRDYLKKIIDSENKMKPLSDESISRMMHEQGIPCARRTIAKYRTEMKIGNTKQRKVY